MVNKEFGWNFDNTYITLPKLFYSNINLNPVSSPELIILNDSLSKDLGLNSDMLKTSEGISILSGSKTIDEGMFIAQAYSGHQFGHFTMLGDGRALLIGEQISPSGKRFDIQLKGSGRTPYSRGGDGRAALGPMLREYIISEAMYGLNIPTTRSLSVVKTNEPVYRENVKQGGILTRVASSHIRFGTFEYASNFGTVYDVKLLTDYCIKRHYPNIKDDSDKYINFLKEVVDTHARLIAKWQSVGFIHGVMNTDNMTISGETIDYGPCAFMDTYNPDTVFSSIDTYGRYSYKNQPIMASWNLCRFAETILPLIDKETNKSIEIAQDIISNFSTLQHDYWLDIMSKKIGIFNKEKEDEAIIKDLLHIIKKYRSDYTNTFVSLTLNANKNNKMFNSLEFINWDKSWKKRLSRQDKSNELVLDLMKKYNPSVIPRNHRVDEAISSAEKGNFTDFNNLLKIIKKPYEYSKEQEIYWQVPKNSCSYKTFCGT